jgi:hypothetical protein
MADAASIPPKFIPDEQLHGRDNSGGPGFTPHTADFGDGGYTTGPKPHLGTGGDSGNKSGKK